MWNERKKKEEEDRIMPSLVATTSASARTMFLCMNSAQTNLYNLYEQYYYPFKWNGISF